MILVDTSVWIDHLRRGNHQLGHLLLEDKVLTHPFVVGELACGNLRNRGELLGLLNALPQAQVAEHAEVHRLIEQRKLSGRGLGWVDMHLLASALLTRCRLFTLDRQLIAAAEAMDLLE